MRRQGFVPDMEVVNAELCLLLTSILDCLIPSDGRLPGAGGAGIVRYIDALMAGSEDTKQLFLQGLYEIEAASSELSKSDFGSLAQGQQVGILSSVEANHPAFFALLIENTYKGYYSNPEILRILGFAGRLPQPEGDSLHPFESHMLENVKKRGKRYREA